MNHVVILENWKGSHLFKARSKDFGTEYLLSGAHVAENPLRTGSLLAFEIDQNDFATGFERLIDRCKSILLGYSK